MSWSSLEIASDSQDILDGVVRVAWDRAYANAFLNFRHAVFLARLDDGRMRLYFSPAARDLSDALGGTPCIAPERTGLRLAAGDSRSWDVWFPSRQEPARQRRTHHPA